MCIRNLFLSALLAWFCVGQLSAQYKVYTTEVSPLPSPLAGHYAGELNQQLWTWGGYQYVDYWGGDSVCKKTNLLAHGATAPVPQGLLCLGGWNEVEGSQADVFLLKRKTYSEEISNQWLFDRSSHQLLQKLPKRLHHHTAVYDDGYVYVLGGQEDSLLNRDVYRFAWPDGEGWEKIAELPNEYRIGAKAAIQSNPKGRGLYVFGGYGVDSLTNRLQVHRHVLCLDLPSLSWNSLPISANVSIPEVGFSLVSSGCASVILIGGARVDSMSSVWNPTLYDFQSDIWVFNTYTHSWSRMRGDDKLKRAYAGLCKVDGFWFLSGGEVAPQTCSAKVTCVEWVKQRQFSPYVVCIASGVCVACALLMYWMLRKRTNKLARTSHLMAGLSIYANAYGALSMWVLPLLAFLLGWQVLAVYGCSVLWVVYTLNRYKRGILSSTAYTAGDEALFRTSSKSTWRRVFVSVFMVFMWVLWLVLPSVILSKATGCSVWWCLLCSLVIPLLGVLDRSSATLRLLSVLQTIVFFLFTLLCLGAMWGKLDFSVSPSSVVGLTDLSPSSPWLYLLLYVFFVPSMSFPTKLLKQTTMGMTVQQTTASIHYATWLMAIGGLLSVCLGIGLRNFYMQPTTIFPLEMPHISLLLPSFVEQQFPMYVASGVLCLFFVSLWSVLSDLFNGIRSHVSQYTINAKILPMNSLFSRIFLFVILTILSAAALAFI